MDLIYQLQNWYLSNCDEDWEHQYGVTIDTLDNPGWSVKIDLTGTKLLASNFSEVSYGVGEESEPGANNWLRCWVEGNQFHGAGGPEKLGEILQIFLNWAASHEQPAT